MAKTKKAEVIVVPYDPLTYKLPEGKSLVLRSNDPELKSYGGFQWPESGLVKAPDWKDNTECGGGLHGWLWAKGDYSLKNKDPKAKWLAVEVDTANVRELSGKVKFPEGNVLYCGSFKEAYDIVMKWYWLSQVTLPNADTPTTTEDEAHAATTGESAHAATTGRYAHAATTGESAHAATTGRYAHAATTGESAHAATTGYSAHAATTGYSAHAATTGESAHAATTGESATACVLGLNGRAKCGPNGSIVLTYWDGNRYRHIIGYAGEDGIEADKWYSLNSELKLQEVKNV